MPPRVVPPLDMRRQAGLFARGGVLRGWNHELLGFPAIAVTMPACVAVGDTFPELLTSGLAALTDDVGDDLPSRATQRNPHPALSGFFQDK